MPMMGNAGTNAKRKPPRMAARVMGTDAREPVAMRSKRESRGVCISPDTMPSSTCSTQANFAALTFCIPPGMWPMIPSIRSQSLPGMLCFTKAVMPLSPAISFVASQVREAAPMPSLGRVLPQRHRADFRGAS